MFVSGGTPPYEIFIPALNSPVFTPVNSTHLNDARFTYINRAPPGTFMMGRLFRKFARLVVN
jgi:hypothetical protein